MSTVIEKKTISSGPLECKVKLEGILSRATVELQSLLAQQLSRLQREYEAIRAAHFPCVVLLRGNIYLDGVFIILNFVTSLHSYNAARHMQ
jgi:hypothetical protein